MIEIIPEVNDINQTLDLLIEPGGVCEIRALGVLSSQTDKPHIESGYYTDLDKAAQDAAEVSPKATGVYLCLNPFNPDLLSRSENELTRGHETTADSDVLSRRWLPIDFDAKRPSKTSATDAEKQEGMACARRVRDFLRLQGWPEPIFADSGNGAGLLYRIDLPADKDALQLVKGCIQALKLLFETDAVSIDQTVTNAARIWKLYGTLARKGENTTERPHRVSKLLEVPETLDAVAVEKLQALADMIPSKAATRPQDQPQYDGLAFDLDAFIERHGLQVDDPFGWEGGRKWVFPVCPFNPDHDNRSAILYQLESGAVGFMCHHNGCAENKWHELRELLEPGWRARQATNTSAIPGNDSNSGNADTKNERQRPTFLSAAELETMEFAEVKWAVPGLIPAGVSLLAGPPKAGKSFLCLQFAVAVASGGVALGNMPVEQGDVLYLALEDTERRLQDRLREMLHGDAFPPRLHIQTKWLPFESGGREHLRAALAEYPDVRLVIIDVLERVRSQKKGNANGYSEDYSAIATIKELADEFDVAIVVVHHTRKTTADDVQDMISGTNGLAGAADTTLVLRRGKEGGATLHLRGRDVEEDEIALCRHPHTVAWVAVGDAREQAMSEERKEVRRAIREHGNMTPKETSQCLAEHYGIRRSEGATRKLMWQMANDGQLQVAKGGKYGNSGNSGNPCLIPQRVTDVTDEAGCKVTQSAIARHEVTGVTDVTAIVDTNNRESVSVRVEARRQFVRWVGDDEECAPIEQEGSSDPFADE